MLRIILTPAQVVAIDMKRLAAKWSARVSPTKKEGTRGAATPTRFAPLYALPPDAERHCRPPKIHNRFGA